MGLMILDSGALVVWNSAIHLLLTRQPVSFVLDCLGWDGTPRWEYSLHYSIVCERTIKYRYSEDTIPLDNKDTKMVSICRSEKKQVLLTIGYFFTKWLTARSVKICWGYLRSVLVCVQHWRMPCILSHFPRRWYLSSSMHMVKYFVNGRRLGASLIRPSIARRHGLRSWKQITLYDLRGQDLMWFRSRILWFHVARCLAVSLDEPRSSCRSGAMQIPNTSERLGYVDVFSVSIFFLDPLPLHFESNKALKW